MKKLLTKFLISLCLIILPCTIVLTGCDESGIEIPVEVPVEVPTVLTNEQKLAMFEKYINNEIKLDDETKAVLDFNGDEKLTKEDYSIIKAYLTYYDFSNDGEFDFPYSDVKIGDVNLDGEVNAEDRNLLKNYIKFLNPDTLQTTKSAYALNLKQLLNADINSNGEININDLTAFDELTQNQYKSQVDNEELAEINSYKTDCDFNGDGLVNGEDERLYKLISLYYDSALDNDFSLPYTEVRIGDVNLDGKVDWSDFELLESYIDGTNSERLSLKALINADIDGNGMVSEGDTDEAKFYEEIMGIKKLNEIINSLENGERSFNINFNIVKDGSGIFSDSYYELIDGKTIYSYDKTKQVSYSYNQNNYYMGYIFKVAKVGDKYIRYVGEDNYGTELTAKYIVSSGEVSRNWSVNQSHIKAIGNVEKYLDQQLISVESTLLDNNAYSVKITYPINDDLIYEITSVFNNKDLLEVTIAYSTYTVEMDELDRVDVVKYTFETSTSKDNFKTKIDEFDNICTTTGSTEDKETILLDLEIDGKSGSVVHDGKHYEGIYLECGTNLKSALIAKIQELQEDGATFGLSNGKFIPEGKEIDKVYFTKSYGDCAENAYSEVIEVTDDFILESWMKSVDFFGDQEWFEVKITLKDATTSE